MLDNSGVIHDQRMPKWWDKWVNPTTVLTLLGGLVWGIQLNMYVMSLQDKVSQVEGRQSASETTANKIIVIVEKQNVILENLLKQVEKLENFKDDHNSKAAEWHERIIKNESRNR